MAPARRRCGRPSTGRAAGPRSCSSSRNAPSTRPRRRYNARAMSGATAFRVACVLMVIAAGQIAAPEPKPDVHLVVSLLATRTLEQPVAGLSIAVARRGVVVDSRGFGFADEEN